MGLIRAGEDARDPRVRRRIEEAGYAVLVEGRQFWHHWPYFDEPRQYIEVGNASPRRDGIYCRKVARNTDARTFIVSMVPGLSYPTDAATEIVIEETSNRPMFECLYGSLVIDYILRLKTSANVLIYVLESLPDLHGNDLEELAKLATTAQDSRHTSRADHANALAAFDAGLARAIGLTESEYGHVLASFPALGGGADSPGSFRSACLAALSGQIPQTLERQLANDVVWWAPSLGWQQLAQPVSGQSY